MGHKHKHERHHSEVGCEPTITTMHHFHEVTKGQPQLNILKYDPHIQPNLEYPLNRIGNGVYNTFLPNTGKEDGSNDLTFVNRLNPDVDVRCITSIQPKAHNVIQTG